MFYGAAAFDQLLGWCLETSVETWQAFTNTDCTSNTCGVIELDDCPITGYVLLTDDNIQAAVDLWVDDVGLATVTYGHISTWDVSAVTDMSELFSGKNFFNDDISGWDARCAVSE